VWLLNNNAILKSALLIQLMYIHDILLKIISIGSCTPFYKKNLSGLEAFPNVISQGRHFKLICRLSIHLKQQTEGLGGSFIHFHTKLMFTRCSVFEIKLHRDKFKETGYENYIYNSTLRQQNRAWFGMRLWGLK
jgi:hypothetical protein